MNHSTRFAIGAAAVMMSLNVALRAGAQVSAPPTAQATSANAWQMSLALEGANEIRQARVVLVEAWGERPAFYDVCIRLAWLALRLGESRESVDLYRRARELPGALPEVNTGLTWALTAFGYQQLERGNVPAARRAFAEALTLSPHDPDAAHAVDLVGASHSVAGEAWVGHLTASADSSAAQLLYLHLPIRLNDNVSIRAAYRHVGSPTAAAGAAGLFGTQDEIYGAIAVERGVTATEIALFSLSNTLSSSQGFAVSSRAGGHTGIAVTVAGISQSSGWNFQFVPQAFTWLSPYVAIGAGVRFTHDSLLSAASPLVSLTLRMDPVEIDAQAHFGKERWAYSPAGPTILSFLANTSSGVTITGTVQAGKMFTMFGQLQSESITGSTGDSRFTSLAGGLRITH